MCGYNKSYQGQVKIAGLETLQERKEYVTEERQCKTEITKYQSNSLV